MATISDTIGFNRGSAAYPADSLNKHYRVDVILDFPKIIAARAAAGAAALTSTDVIQAIPVPAKTLVASVGMEIITVGASGSLALGDGTAGAGYLAATVSTSTGMFGGVPVLSSGAFAPTLSGGKVYSAEDTIDVTLSTAVPSAAVVRVFAVMVDMS